MSDATATLMRDQHAEAIMLGLGCPFDCARCEAEAMRHDHPTVCGHPVTCTDDHCFDDARGPAPVVSCLACEPAPVPAVPCTSPMPF